MNALSVVVFIETIREAIKRKKNIFHRILCEKLFN